MIVITLVAILSGIMIGSLASLRSTSLAVSAREFADFVNLCRSEAIARHTAVRVAIVESSSGDPEENFRKYSAFAWNRRSREFEQYRAWESLPLDLSFDPRFPAYIRKSGYFRRDPSSVRGDYIFDLEGNDFPVESAVLGATYRMRYLQFSPAGRASAPGSDLRNLILVMSGGDPVTRGEATNWAHFSIDTLTGRLRIYRP